MKVIVDGHEILELSEIKKKVIKNDIKRDEFDADMKRRLVYILEHKYERCLGRLKDEWIPKLKGRVDSIPLDDDKLAELIMSQPDYKCRATREAEWAAQCKAEEDRLAEESRKMQELFINSVDYSLNVDKK